MVKKLISSCVACARLREKPMDQLKGQLPEERLEQTALLGM